MKRDAEIQTPTQTQNQIKWTKIGEKCGTNIIRSSFMIYLKGDMQRAFGQSHKFKYETRYLENK